MFRPLPFAMLLLAAALLQGCAGLNLPGLVRNDVRQRRLFNDDWRFHAGEVEGGQRPELAVADWEAVELPHDYMIEGKGQWAPRPAGTRRGGGAAPGVTGPEMHGPFDRNSPGGNGNGFLNGGIGWYRKSFSLPETARGKRFFLEFEGIYMDSTVWLNGKMLGSRPYGYSTFELELTDGLNYGAEPNIVAVRSVCQQPNSRWYSGAGIYRHVWMTATDPVHVAQWGTHIRTPEVTAQNAPVLVSTLVRNQSSAAQTAEVATSIMDGGRVVAETKSTMAIPADGLTTFSQSIDLASPKLWSLDSPHLYVAVSKVSVGGKPTDSVKTNFGVRTIKFTKDEGFFLNGVKTPIYGVCNHHDLGPLGAAAFDRGIERQLEIMKEMGVNAIRTSHNMPAPALLDYCDKMGFLVMDESFDMWVRSKTALDYARFFPEWAERDMTDFVMRDRNHPSVFMWSIGNEIPDQGNANGKLWSARLAEICKRLDPDRAVTSGMNSPVDAIRSGFAASLDLYGINYNLQNYDRAHDLAITYASETSSNFSARGEYNLVLNEQTGKVEIQTRLNTQDTAYDLDFPRWGNTAEVQFAAMKAKPYIFGEFVWTGFDYIGEPTPFPWPARSSYFGIVDLCGFKKDRFYLYQSQWTKKPMVHLLPHWTWPDAWKGKAIPVWAYTNADSVELFLNGKSIGEKNWKGVDIFHLAWDVPYEPGVLKAVAKRNGAVVAEDTVETVGPAAKLELVADRNSIRADGQDLSFVTVKVVDAQGRIHPDANPLVKLDLQGGGKIAGMDNGDATNLEPFIGNQHLAFNGLMLAVIRAPKSGATMNLTAAAEGLAPATIAITAN